MIPAFLFVSAALGAPAPSTYVPPPVETQVSRASIIIDGTVERVVYLQPDGTSETEPRKAEPPREATLCGPKLITFKVGERLKGTVGDAYRFRRGRVRRPGGLLPCRGSLRRVRLRAHGLAARHGDVTVDAIPGRATA